MKAQRWNRSYLLSAAVIVVLAGSGHEAAAQSSAAEVEAGRQLFMSNGCYSCHGTVGQGGERSSGPRIAPEPYPFEAFKAMVRHPREAMPRFDERFVSDAQLQSIHRYLSSIPKGPGAKDIAQLQAPTR
ncbi:MAG: cytochrome c [Pseudomonadota bacterium]|nr:cytochrome c [Pseudomonadota bacterium]